MMGWVGLGFKAWTHSRPSLVYVMLGGPGVGKTALTQQFVTSEYIAAQNTSFGQSATGPSVLLIIRSFQNIIISASFSINTA